MSRLLQVVVVLLVPVAAPEEDVSVVVHVVQTKQGVELAGCRIKRVEAQSVALWITVGCRVVEWTVVESCRVESFKVESCGVESCGVQSCGV